MLVPQGPSGGVGGPPPGGTPNIAALLQAIMANQGGPSGPPGGPAPIGPGGGPNVPQPPGGMDMRRIALLLAALRAAQNGGGPSGPPSGPPPGAGGMPLPPGMGGPPPIVPPQAL